MVTIRKARRSDVKTVVFLWKAFVKHQQGIFTHDKAFSAFARLKADSAKHFASWARKQIGSKNGVIFLAEVDGGEAVGYSLLVIFKVPPMFSPVEKLGCLAYIFVLEGFRGKGISTKLKDEGLDWLRRKGIRFVMLTVLEKNRVPQAIYKKWGFLPFAVDMRKSL
jgi:GNAT superfamily N-acetyltransferase